MAWPALVLALIAIINRSHADTKSAPVVQHDVIVIQGEAQNIYAQNWVSNQLIVTSYGANGFWVANASSSSNAPTFCLPVHYYNNQEPSCYPMPLAQALADLISAGYRIEHSDNLRYVLVK